MRRVNIANPTVAFDPADPDGFHAGMFRFGAELGAQRTSASLYEPPPGQAVCPYHCEHGEEEWALVLGGHPSVRTPEGIERPDPLDVPFFPTGPAGAHQLRNDSDEPARVLMRSEVALHTGDPAEDAIVERANAVGYCHGEPGVER